MYTLRIKSLLRTFRAFEQSGTLYIEPVYNHTEDQWKAYLRLQQGSVSSCYIQRKSDQQILWKDTKAIQWLETQEKLFWILEDTSHPEPSPPVPDISSSHNQHQPGSGSSARSVTQQTPSDGQKAGLQPMEKMHVHHATLENSPLSLIPQRVLNTEETLAAFSRDHKRVFALIDGHRTTTQIAALLHYTPEHVMQLLQKLQKKGLVKL